MTTNEQIEIKRNENMPTNKKYKLLKNDTIQIGARTLYRIQALRNFSNVHKGDKGGYIEKESNLSHEGYAWVSGDAQVYGDAQVFGDAWVSGDAQVSGTARIFEDAWVSGDAQVSGTARIFEDAHVFGDARVFGNALVSGNAWVSGDANVFGNAQVFGHAKVSIGADITVDIDFEIPRIKLDNMDKVNVLMKVLKKLE